MRLKTIVEQVISAKTLTPSVENEINHLLWSKEFDTVDMEALSKLIDVLLNGTVNCVGYTD
ncbi:hypothetical protein BST81_17455 [Leptolyngbya sp. 'hensonii']|nr:hypothetical protein BST81_17455 [Leptolyngbya sp. 'hensonii']